MIHAWKYFDEWINEAIDSTETSLSSKWKRDEDSEKWKISFILPGVKKEEVEVTSGKGWARVKYPNGSFRLSLPRDCDHDTVEAKLDLGILEIFVKESNASTIKTIKVQ